MTEVYTRICTECNSMFSMDLDNIGYCCVKCYVKHILQTRSVILNRDWSFFNEHIKHFLDKKQVEEAISKLTTEIM